MDKEIFLRKYALKLIFPLAKKWGISPEFLFGFRIFFAVITGIALFFGNYLISVLFLTICQFVFMLDYIDGTLARHEKRFSFKMLELDRIFHYAIPFLFLLGVTVSYFVEYKNSFFLAIGLIGTLSILSALLVEMLWRKNFKIQLSQIREIQDTKRKSFSNLRSFLIVDSPLSLFYLLILFNLLPFAIVIFSLVRVIMFYTKIKNVRQIIKKRNVKKELSEYYAGSQASNYNYFSDAVGKDIFDKEISIIKRFITRAPKGKILDVACGTGRTFPCYGNRKIFGVDISKEMLEQAKRDYPESHLQISDAKKLPFKSGTFSAVITARFICHTPEYREVIKEMVRVTKPGGSIILDFPNKHSLAVITTKVRIFFGAIRYFNFFTYEDIEKIAGENNLQIAEIEHKAFLPPKIFSKYLWFLTKRLNEKLIRVFPNFSTPYHVRFVKLK